MWTQSAHERSAPGNIQILGALVSEEHSYLRCSYCTAKRRKLRWCLVFSGSSAQTRGMNKKRFLSVLGFSGLLLVGCVATAESEVSIMEDGQAQAEIPAHVQSFIQDFSAADTNIGQSSDHPGYQGQDLKNFTLIDAGENFTVFAARDDDHNWCVVLDNKPLADQPDDWAIGISCAPSENFVADGLLLQIDTPTRTHTAQLLPDNFTGEIAPTLERINDNLAAK